MSVPSSGSGPPTTVKTQSDIQLTTACVKHKDLNDDILHREAHCVLETPSTVTAHAFSFSAFSNPDSVFKVMINK